MRKRTKNNVSDRAGTENAAASLVRGLSILRAFTAGDATLGNQELIERTGLPKATVSRLTASLMRLGYLHYDEALGRYSIGPATVSLGYTALSSNPVVQLAGPLMQELADRTGGAVALGALDGLEMVYLSNRRSMSPVTLQLNVGSRLPVWRTAMGIAYLAETSPGHSRNLLASLGKADPGNRALMQEKVMAAQKHYAKKGFVCAFGNWYSYINAVGTAFQPTDGSPLVALTCGAIVDIFPKKKCLEEIGPLLVELKRKLNAMLTGAELP